MPRLLSRGRAVLSLGLALASLSGAASAQELLSPTPRAVDPWALMGRGQYLPGLVLAEQRHASGNDPMAADTLAVLQAATGQYREAMRTMGEGGSPSLPPDPEAASGLAELERLDAVEAIVQLAKDRQIVILNEAHHVPQTRWLSLAVARRLREQGFTHLACEAFSPAIRQYAEQGHPTHATCFGYLTEPVFADLIRQCGRMGYEFVPYEIESMAAPATDRVDSINRREIAQSRNLIERIFAEDPEAKVLVHCGYSHATEDWRTMDDGREMAWMAARLGRELGLDPLTVDQTHLRPRPVDGQSPAVWFAAVREGRVPRASVFRRSDGSFFTTGSGWEGRVDLQVFHPRAEHEGGRPDWLSMDGHRLPVEIPADLDEPGARVLVQAFVESEGEGAIPMDQVLWLPDEVPPVLMLPEGVYRIEVQDEQGEVVARSEVVSG